ncbi:MAG: NAD(P)/FAD-dependent oxidoreductase [Candidatus Hinthialibacter antarcticus]|nr:NAD(P)/FAD-dependent oxidoreductase [Candidatus Hinthialibacter antarcticus]
MTSTNDFDALIIGAGPAGASAAAVLAKSGRRVMVLEKEKFPRYHIGESLLPYCYFPLERLGVLDKIKQAGYTNKYSVQFVNPMGKLSAPFYFEQHMEHEASRTWQVPRDQFDQLMIDHAREQGAQVQDGVAVKDFIVENGATVGVVIEDEEKNRKELRAPFTIDASGRNSLAIARNRWRKMDPKLNKTSIWTRYKGAKRDEGKDEGATTVAYIPDNGWFWYIPLPDDIVSVGLVAEREYLYRDSRDLDTIFQREIKSNPWIEDHLSVGERCTDYWATGEYSYRSEYCASDGLVLTGDAFAFLDPVFSSGVLLALLSGELAGEAIHKALERNDVSAEQFAEYGEKLIVMIEAMRKLVYAFYDQDFRFKDFLMKYPNLRGDLTDCLIGHLEKDFDPLFSAVSEFVELPKPLPHGRPLIAATT